MYTGSIKGKKRGRIGFGLRVSRKGEEDDQVDIFNMIQKRPNTSRSIRRPGPAEICTSHTKTLSTSISFTI